MGRWVDVLHCVLEQSILTMWIPSTSPDEQSCAPQYKNSGPWAAQDSESFSIRFDHRVWLTSGSWLVLFCCASSKQSYSQRFLVGSPSCCHKA